MKIKEYIAKANYSNRAGQAMVSGPYRSRARAEEAAIAMTAKGYEGVWIETTEVDEDEDEDDS